jgi:hypothetical protein
VVYKPDLVYLNDWCLAILERRYTFIDERYAQRVIAYYRRDIEFALKHENAPKRRR